MSLTVRIIDLITSFISTGGYPALFVLTFFDSTILPVPNEAIMPFAGFLISGGRFSFITVLTVSAVGGMLGALTSYAIGYYGAEAFVRRWGRYARLTMDDIQKTHAFFMRRGELIILISRFIPVVRQFVSIPAGAAKMKLWKFCLYTIIGSALWNSAILYAGYFLGEQWTVLKPYMQWVDRALIAAVVIYGAFWFLKIYKKRSLHISRGNPT